MSNKQTQTVPIPSLDKVLNYKQNVKYLQLKRNKFWNLCEERRSKYIPTSEHEAALVAFNEDYVQKNSTIPIASLRIKEGGGYSLHFKPDLSKLPFLPICDVPIKGGRKPITDKDIQKISECNDPTMLMLISDEEQMKHQFTVEEKKGAAMCEEVLEEGKKPSETQNDDDNKKCDDDDSNKKRKFTAAYNPRRIIAPPEYPFAYLRLKDDERCEYCGCIGKDCHNVRYGGYLAAVIARFHNEHEEDYNEHDAVRLFSEVYTYISEFEEYLDDQKIDARLNNVLLPECMVFDSLVFALNSVEWTVMWETNQKKVKNLRKYGKMSVASSTKNTKKK